MKKISVVIVYATSAEQWIEAVEVKPETTVAQAISLSGVLARFPEVDLATQAVGIYGRRVRLSEPVNDGDRVEIYRPLPTDPKEMRRRRARMSPRRGSKNPG